MTNKEYTDEQISNILNIYSSVEEMERITALREAQNYLTNTDYIIIKMQEYQLTGQELNEDYTDILKKREEAREVLRRLKEVN